MELEILKLVFDYSKNRRVIDTKYIEKLIEIVTKANSLNDYVKEINWRSESIETNNGMVLAGYDLQRKFITIYLNSFSISLERSDKYDYLFKGFEQFFYQNLKFTQFILHELEHANQNKLVDSNANDLEIKFLRASFIVTETFKNPALWTAIKKGEVSNTEVKKYILHQEELYEQFYKENPSERLAQIKSFKVINDILMHIKEYVPNLSQFEQASLLEEMLNGYSQTFDGLQGPTQIYLTGTNQESVLTGLDFFNNDTKQMHEKVRKKYNLGERLTYGLPITNTEFEQTQDMLYRSNKYS